MPVATTFQVFQQTLRETIDRDNVLSVVMKSALKLRVEALAKTVPVVFGAATISSVSGNVSVDQGLAAVTVGAGAPATANRIEWSPVSFATPVRISGSQGYGVLLGHAGEDEETGVVDFADIDVFWRAALSDPWRRFSRVTVIDEATTVYFAAEVAEQAEDLLVPQLWILAEQL